LETWRALRNSAEWASGEVGFVPTMGALHAGHEALLARARKENQRVVLSIFVNPAQFNDPGDLARYPRREERDLAMLEEAGCEVAWLPTVSDMYPDGFATTVSVAGISKRWEGEHRPGHFDGVATVVAKLLIACEPDVALFGEKDFQQLAVIRRVVADLGLPVEILGVPTVRDSDGLALSSRNLRLSAAERLRALAIPRGLTAGISAHTAGEDPAAAARSELEGLNVDYAEVVLFDGEPTLVVAARAGSTRLIDNVPLNHPDLAGLR